MKKLVLILCCIGFYGLIQAQTNTDNDALFHDGECLLIEDTGIGSRFNGPLGNISSENGRAFTPSGDLRALVIFVDFEGANNVDHPFPGWEVGQLPDIVNPTTGEMDFAHSNLNDFSNLNNPDPNAHLNISEFYYHMSNGEFRFIFETLKDDNGIPSLITINVDGVQDFSDLNSITFNKVRELFPTRNWRQLGFDNRAGFPNFSFDNSSTFVSPNPDGVLDYVVTVYRDRTRVWVNHPNGDTAPANNPAASGFSPANAVALGNTTSFPSLSTTPPPESESFSISGPLGFTYLQFENEIPEIMRLFIHEVAHTYISHPHTAVENTVHGRYYNANRDWSMMDYGRSSSLSNAWERWFSGWIDIKHDLEDTSDNGTYFLGDYMQTDDAMRLKIPHTTDQFLWLTFRSDLDNPFYERTRGNSALVPPNEPNTIPIDISNEGLYGLYERIAASRPETNFSDVFSDGANGTRIMTGTGYHDFNIQEILRESSPVLVGLIQEDPNPYGQLGNPVAGRFDLNDDGEILIIPTTNGGGNDNEIAHIAGIDGQRVFGPESENIDLPSGQYSVFTNPPIQNFLEFNDFETNSSGTEDGIETLTPTILHSLSFNYERIGDQARITVDYDDGHIRDDFRMTGNVFLPANEDITLDANRTLTVNRSGTNNRETPSPAGDFINETVFKIAGSGSFRANQSSTIILDEASTTIFEENSQLDLRRGARIIIRGGALLCIQTTDVILHPNAQIIIEDGFLNVSSGIDISANVVNNSPFPFPTIADVINFCTPSTTPQHLHSNDLTRTGRDVCSGNDVVVTPGQSLLLTSQNLILMEPGFQAQAGASYQADIRTVIPQDCDIEFYFGSSGTPPPTFKFGSNFKNNIDNIPELNMFVYPNPSRDIFNVEIQDAKGSFNYQIKNLDGVTLKEGKTTDSSFSVNTSGIGQGIYILIVSSGTLVSTQQIVKL